MTKRLLDLADELQVTELLRRQLSDVEQSLKWLHLEKANSPVVAACCLMTFGSGVVRTWFFGLVGNWQI